LWQPLRHVYTLLIVMFSLVFFRSRDLAHARDYLSALIDFSSMAIGRYSAWYYLNTEVILALITGTLWATPLLARRVALIQSWSATRLAHGALVYQAGAGVLHLLLAALCFLQVAAGTYQPFIYFRF
jgi:alginate O-acetyltransferase complex protein AlgI